MLSMRSEPPTLLLADTCVVTLDPLESTIEEDFAAVFWPEADLPAPESGELALDDLQRFLNG